jgi:transcriptional regulator with XRE-family HTH domain
MGYESARMATAHQIAHALDVEIAESMQAQPPVSRLRQARYRAGLTTADLAANTGVSRKAIRLFERGARPAQLSTLAKLARALGVELLDLMDNEPELCGLRRAGYAAGLTEAQLSANSAVSRRIIRQVERGERQGDTATMARLAEALKVEPAELTCRPSTLDVSVANQQLEEMAPSWRSIKLGRPHKARMSAPVAAAPTG